MRRTYGNSKDGNKQWAIVTGASEGIGREYAKELAKSGFNIAISSRSQEKLDKVKESIEAVNKGVEVRPIVNDFGLSCYRPKFCNSLCDQMLAITAQCAN